MKDGCPRFSLPERIAVTEEGVGGRYTFNLSVSQVYLKSISKVDF